jgi:predicted dienelactone hydrolase
MRTLEFVLWLAVLIWSAGWIFGGLRRPVRLAAIATVLAIAGLHGWLEGARVQMAPTYVIGALLGIFTATRWGLPHAPVGFSTYVRGTLIVAFAAAMLVGAVLPSAFPVFAYDEPTGPYSIGTAIYVLEHGPANRDLVAQAWYPVDRTTAHRNAPTGITSHPSKLAEAYGSFTGLPTALFDHLRLVKTHAVLDASIAGDRSTFPVVLFSHGPLAANRSQSVFQMEALASAGYIVVAIDHTGYASATIFPDGRVIPPGADAAWPAVVDERSTAMVRTWVADVGFVLDRLEALNRQDPKHVLTGRLDLARVGYLGASFGGSVVVQALVDEPRIKAGVAEDGKPYFSDRALTDLRRPLMYMQSEAPYIKSSDAQLARWSLTQASFRSAEQDHYARQMQLFGRTGGAIYNVFIRGTNHVTFSDLDLIIRLPDWRLLDIRRAHRIINAYTVAFFDRYLAGLDAPLVNGRTPSPYPEVTVASRNVTNGETFALSN